MRRHLKPMLAVAALLCLTVSNAQAIPAFARKYSQSCKTCHAPFPKLKPYGDDFASTGFVIKDKETPREE